MNLVNLTPHELVIHRKEGGEPMVLSRASGRIPRVSVSRQPLRMIDGVEVTRVNFGWVTDMPTPEKGTIFVVTRVVADALPNRMDLLCPGELIRNVQGEVVGVQGLTEP